MNATALTLQLRSRDAAEECSPRRKPWENIGKTVSPEGAKENMLRFHATPSI